MMDHPPTIASKSASCTAGLANAPLKAALAWATNGANVGPQSLTASVRAPAYVLEIKRVSLVLRRSKPRVGQISASGSEIKTAETTVKAAY